MWPPMPSETPVGAHDHRHRVPADQALDAALDLLAAGQRRLLFGTDRVDVGRDRRERQRDALHAGVVPQGRRAAAGRVPGPPARSRSRATRAIRAFRSLRARSRHAARYSSSDESSRRFYGPVQSTHSMPAREARASSVSANDRPAAFVKYMKSQMLIVAAALACAAGAAAFAGGPSVQQTSTMPDRAAITKMRRDSPPSTSRPTSPG